MQVMQNLSHRPKVYRVALGLGAFFCSIGHAQPPAINQNGVVNAASNMPPTLPGGSLARGAKFKVEGVRLSGAASSAPPGGEPAVVLLTQGNVSARARVVLASPSHIEAVVPADAPLGKAELRVLRGKDNSASFPVVIVPANTGLYSRNGEGWGPGRIRNLGDPGSENSPALAAQPSERIAIAATGVGSGEPPPIFIGGQAATVVSAKHNNDSGEDELIVEIPPSAPQGCFVPVYAQHNQMPPSNVITVAIHRGGGACQMLGPATGRRAGTIVLARSSMLDRHGKTSVGDEAAAAFVENATEPAWTRLALSPPVGTCTAYTGSYQSSFRLGTSISASLLSSVGEQGLDVGDSILLRRGEETRQIPRIHGATGLYSARLGDADSPGVAPRMPLILEPGQLTVVSPGGRDTGPFQVHGGAAPSFTWTNRDEVAQIDRAQPLRLTWSPLRLDQAVLIVATSVDQFTTATAMCYCLASGLRTEFTVPASMLANFPVTANVPGLPLTQLVVASITARTDTQAGAPGLDTISVISLFANMRAVAFR